MKNTALLVVDVQTKLIEGHPHNWEQMLHNLKALIESCRAKGVEIIYIRHDDGPESDLAMNSEGWQIYHEIAPVEGEKIFDKRFNSAFRQTELKEYLDSRGIQNLILVGMQTELCMDSTCKVAFEYGYTVMMPEETNTTFSNACLSAEALYTLYNSVIWPGRFAQTMNVEDMQKRIAGE